MTRGLNQWLPHVAACMLAISGGVSAADSERRWGQRHILIVGPSLMITAAQLDIVLCLKSSQGWGWSGSFGHLWVVEVGL